MQEFISEASLCKPKYFKQNIQIITQFPNSSHAIIALGLTKNNKMDVDWDELAR